MAPANSPRPAERHSRLLICLLLLTAGVGCSGPDPLEVKVRRCASLPGATNTPNEQLARAVAILRERGETPDSWRKLPVPPDANAALALEKLLAKRLTPRIEEKVAGFFHHDRWLDDAETIESVESFLDFHTKLFAELDDAASKEYCVFDCHFEYGFFASLGFLDQTAFAVRVQLLQASHAGRYGETQKAGAALEQALHWCAWLANSPRLEARLLGAELRSETLEIAGMMFIGGWLGREEGESLYRVLRAQLADWPKDSKSLVGDRMVTMHTYEVLREGMIDRVLTGRETAALGEEGRLNDLKEANSKELDQDELNYLDAMQLMIDASSEAPLYVRQEQIEKARTLAGRAPDLFANRVFLNEIPSSLNFMARDRALCEAWCIALAQSVDFELPPFRVNPSNGKDYGETRDSGNITILLHDPAVINPSCPDF